MLEALFQFLGRFIQSILSVLKVLLLSNLFLKKHQTKEKKCIILGNGPSIKPLLKENPDFLSKSPLICVNNFPNTPYYEVVKPQYFIITSEEFWGSKKTIDPNTQLRKDIIQAFLQKTTWKVVFFIPASSKKDPTFLQQFEANTNIQIQFFNKTPLEGLEGITHFLFSRAWGMPRPHNVLIPAIMNAIQSGFKEITLLGADHSWIPLISVNEKNEAMVAQKHFYDTNAQKEKMYRKGTRPRRLHEILEKFMLSFRAYFEIKAFAEKKGVQIWNATPNSFIDAFDRKTVEELEHE